MNAPFTQLTTFVSHYLHCKQLLPGNTSACDLVSVYMMPVLECLLLGMTCLKRFIKGAALSEQSTRSGNLATSPSLNWPGYVFTHVPTGADQALTREEWMHRAAVISSSAACNDFDSKLDERLVMLFKGCL